MNALLKREGLEDKLDVESAGTGAWHVGDRPDPRAIEHGSKRGYEFNTRAQQFESPAHFKEFDYIVTMDNSNYSNVISLDTNGKYTDKVFKMTDFCSKSTAKEVPDPYYGGGDHFEEVIDLLEDACEGFLKKFKKDLA
jgi:protein-tyrosine phosphatase